MDRRKFTKKLALVVAITSFAGCSGDSTSSTEPTKTDTSSSSEASPGSSTNRSRETTTGTDKDPRTSRRERTTSVPSSTTPVSQTGTSSNSTCPLVHDLTKASTPVTPSEDSLSYTNLSTEAKQIFDRAREQEESVIIQNESAKPPEFRYTDERTGHFIEYEGERYVFYAYTYAGCSFTTEPTS